MSFPDPAAEVHMALTELRRSPLVEQAIDRLREQVTSGAWPVGTRLPSEAALAAELGVGRSAIRAADPEAAAAATSAHLDATIRTLQALLDDPGQAAR